MEDGDVTGGPATRQRLDGEQTLGNTTYDNLELIEAEFMFTVTDGTSTWTLASINIGGSGGTNYQTVPGLVVLNDGNGILPKDVPLRITSTSEVAPFDPDGSGDFADYEDYVPCFTLDTMIETDLGTKAAKDFEKGPLMQAARYVLKKHEAETLVKRL